MPTTFESPQARLALWTALETLGESQGTFAYWAELRSQRKSEIASVALSLNQSLAMQTAHPDDMQFVNILFPHMIPRSHGLPSVRFPLSADHQLFLLIQHNVLRGAMTNMSILLDLNNHPLKGWDDFYTEDLAVQPDKVPPSLRPTDLQKAISHEAWIDVLPDGVLRDNILKNQDRIDIDGLCDDLMGGMELGVSDVQNRGVILWGEPWSEDGWEVSNDFARKWSFLLDGCDGLIRSTNKWREARDEEKLIIEL